ncbi:FtsQ-type POTRA domain-containing protein [Alkalihalobacillus macyae]|uniref:cell division protein FtsQ/DivIB n=1 Tax=Guptibacillus hwajinpoensis TaxID=208199 RepID=UPI00273A98C7|nr:FtsQ-type POTRA domain-containing protein [Alkalihalobacillus macyae]MDP4553092.1 FtsQ-type POTRA domain-containing protein [Alkalihalobacillus macyae]
MEDRKVVTIEDRIPTLKAQRKQRANRRLIVYLSIFFFLILLIIYFQSSLSHIRNVDVSGNNYVSQEEIQKLSGVDESISFWNINTKKIAESVEKSKEISDAKVSRKFPATVLIEVTENERVAYLKKGSKYFPILQTGSILEALPKGDTPVSAPILMQWNESTELSDMAGELRKVKMSVINRISEIHYTPDDTKAFNLTLYMTDGYEVRTSITTFSEKVNSYPLIVNKLRDKPKGILYLNEGSWLEPYEEVKVEEKPES